MIFQGRIKPVSLLASNQPQAKQEIVTLKTKSSCRATD
jgi:hypothetical protein